MNESKQDATLWAASLRNTARKTIERNWSGIRLSRDEDSRPHARRKARHNAFAAAGIAIAGMTVTGAASAQQANSTSTLYEEHFGYWDVKCSKDAMYGSPNCFMIANTEGKGPFGPTTMQYLEVVDLSGPNGGFAKNVGFRNPQMAWRLTPLELQVDSGQPSLLSCARVEPNICLLAWRDENTGQQPAVTAMNAFSGAKESVRLRVEDVSHNPYDFVWNMTTLKKLGDALSGDRWDMSTLRKAWTSLSSDASQDRDKAQVAFCAAVDHYITYNLRLTCEGQSLYFAPGSMSDAMQKEAQKRLLPDLKLP